MFRPEAHRRFRAVSFTLTLRVMMRRTVEPTPDIQILAATSDHRESIRELYLLVGGPHDHILPFLQQPFPTEDFVPFVAVHDYAVVGVGCAFVLEPYVWLMGLRVHPDWRNHKIGQQLVERRVQFAAARCQPVKAVVLAANAPVVRVFTNAGFASQPGFTLMEATIGAVRPSHFWDRSVVRAATAAERAEVASFLNVNYQLASDHVNLFGEDFVWRPISSANELGRLVASRRLLVSRGEAGTVRGVAVVNPKPDRTVEIGRIWGEPAPFLWHIIETAAPPRLWWYLSGETEEERARQFRFQISRTGTSERRYLIFTKDSA
ncbi:GNAT family N-acetyltransferase [Candidatus Parcubacteria bacterium]|nr:GNAT family N-acetyltransferase [Candidatus Parcubacteria bacterium]